MQLLITFLRRYPAQSLITLIAMLFAGIAEGFGMSMLLPLLGMCINSPATAGHHSHSTLGQLINHLFAAVGLRPTIGLLLVLFVLSIILKVILVLIAKKRVGYMVANVATDLRLALIRSLFATHWEYYVNQPVGAFTNAFATEAGRSANAYLFGMRIIALLLNALVYIAVALMVAWKATFIALAAGLLILYFLRYLVKQAKKAGSYQTLQLKSVLSLMTDAFQSIKPLKAMAREDMVRLVLEQKTMQLNSALQKQVFSKEALKALQEPLTTIFFAFGLYVALMWLHLPMANVLIMVYMLAKILNTLQRAQREYQSMAIAESAYWSLNLRIQETEKKREGSGGTVIPCFRHSIRMEGVNFSYQKDQVLKDVSLSFPKGSFTAIIGPSGAGKTTIVDLITGLLVPKEGKVYVDDISLSQVNIRAWRRMIGYVPQETLLLHDTVLVNVTLGDKNFTEEDVKQALRKAGAWDFVSKMPKGMHSVTGERGSRLSGGQRQRITIARALVHRPQLLILDEATTALDPTSEREICRTLAKLTGELTILAISHQTALLDATDRVYIVKNGTVQRVKK